MRVFWLVLAWVSFVLGIIGAFLPVVPTVPFLILSVWGFAKSSPKMRNRILRHPQFGPPIRDWLRTGAITRRTKIVASVAMASGVVVGWALGLPLWVVGSQATVLLAVAIYLWTRPDKRVPAAAARSAPRSRDI